MKTLILILSSLVCSAAHGQYYARNPAAGLYGGAATFYGGTQYLGPIYMGRYYHYGMQTPRSHPYLRWRAQYRHPSLDIPSPYTLQDLEFDLQWYHNRCHGR
jgi:hypothetical protein